jgi:glycosyltransferase involved in cell wall biosynthesis
MRIAYVMFGGLGGVSPSEALARWPGTPRLLAALVERHGATVSAVWRVPPGTAPVSFVRDGVCYRFVPDRPRLPRRLAAAVAEARPDVVHVNGHIFPLPTLAVRRAVGRHVRIVIQHHGEPPGHGRLRVAQAMASRAVDAHLFTGGEAQAAPWRAARVIGRRTPVHDVLEASTDLAPRPRTAAALERGVHGEPAVLWVGRLVAGKGPLTALAAFERFVAGGATGAHLWMVCGDRSLAAPVDAAIAASEWLRGRVSVIGPVPHAEMAGWYSAADLFLSTSRHEGSGYALIEAMACGCPPVVSDLPSHRAIAGPEGRFFAAEDPIAAASALAGTGGSDADRSAVRAAFTARLTWTAVVDALHAAYGT